MKLTIRAQSLEQSSARAKGGGGQGEVAVPSLQLLNIRYVGQV